MKEKLLEDIFFFGLLGFVGYIAWQILAPFIAPLALAAIIATVCHPLFLRILRGIPRKNRSIAALLSVISIALTIFTPLFLLGYVLFLQIVDFYNSAGTTGGVAFQTSVSTFEKIHTQFFPGLSIDFGQYAKETAGWLASHMGTIFASTASTVFMLFIMLIALFYMLRDGPAFLSELIRISPLPDTQDEYILHKLSSAVRSVVLGTLAIALIQGILTAIGFTIFGVPKALLWGSVASLGALVPGVGTSAVFITAILFEVISGSYLTALYLGLWGIFAIGLIDNFLGPYLVSRGAKLHPFAILLSVLGGAALFGPVGFLLGPVALSFLTVLLELYRFHIHTEKKHDG